VGDRTNPCIAKMRAHNCRHLPILSAGRVIAMLSMRDLLRDEIEERNEEIRHLRAYIHQDPPH
jgi:CBS domain-containing protein